METEKSAAQIEAEKKAIDASGYSEQQMDLNINRQQGDMQNIKRAQQGKKIFSASKTTKETVILEK
jgi:hypothetical protein